jgi:hypothetical protein
LKPKTGFESGSSPQYSPTGAPIGTGRGLEATKLRIVAAFEKARQDPPPQQPASRQTVKTETATSTPPQQPIRVYTEDCAAKFHERAKRLAATALTSAHIFKTSRTNVHEIVVPTESAEQLIREATRRRDED